MREKLFSKDMDIPLIEEVGEEDVMVRKTWGFGKVRIGAVALIVSGLILLALALTQQCQLYWAIIIFGLLISLGLVLLGNEKGSAMSFLIGTMIVFFVALGLNLGNVC